MAFAKTRIVYAQNLSIFLQRSGRYREYMRKISNFLIQTGDAC